MGGRAWAMILKELKPIFAMYCSLFVVLFNPSDVGFRDHGGLHT